MGNILFHTRPGDNMLVLLILQTFVNDVRIQEQMYITLKLEDKLRFGYDILPLQLTSQMLFMSAKNVKPCEDCELFSVLLEILHYRDQYVDVECVFVYHYIFLTCLSHIPTCSRL